jgi:hypothetical protein
MISYSVYKIIHLTGVMMVILGLAGTIGSTVAGHPLSWRKPLAYTHGIGMFLSLLGGFGLLARIGVMHGAFPGWAYAKLAIWLVFGGMLAATRKPQHAKKAFVLSILLFATAAWIAGSKPF